MSLKKELELDELAPTTLDVSEDEDRQDTSADDDSGDEQSDQQESASVPQPKELSGQKPAVKNNSGSPGRPSKNGKWRELQKSLRQANEQNSRFTRELSELRSVVEQLRTASTPAQGAASQAKADDVMTDIVNEMNHLVELAGNESLTPQQRNALSAKYQQLQEKRQDLRWEQREAKLRESILQEARQNMPGGGDQRVASWNAALNQEFPEVMGNDAAVEASRNYYKYLLKVGREDGLPTLREACAHVATQFGYGASRPSKRSQAAYSGVPGMRSTGAGSERSVTISARDKQALKQALNMGLPEEYARRVVAGESFDD